MEPAQPGDIDSLEPEGSFRIGTVLQAGLPPPACLPEREGGRRGREGGRGEGGSWGGGGGGELQMMGMESLPKRRLIL